MPGQQVRVRTRKYVTSWDRISECAEAELSLLLTVRIYKSVSPMREIQDQVSESW